MTRDTIDRAVFDELQEATGAEFVAELVNAFLEEAPGMIADLKAAADHSDADGFRRAAHSIKSNAQVFGASAMAEQARALEHGGLPVDAAQLVSIEAEFDTTSSALRRLLDD